MDEARRPNPQSSSASASMRPDREGRTRKKEEQQTHIMQRHRKKSFSSSHLPKFTLLPPSPQLPEAVTHILESLSLERYIPSFSKEEISEKAFFLLTENDLIRMGLPIGPRKLILDYVFEANNNGHSKQKASKENETDKTANPQRIISSSGEISLRRPNVTLKSNASSSPSSSSSSSDSSTAFSCSEYPSSKSFSSFESSCLHNNSSSSTLSPSSSSYDSLLHRRRFSDSAGLLMNVSSTCSPSSPPAIGLVRLKAKRIQRKQQLQQQQEEEEAKPFVVSVKMTHDETVLSVQKKFKATQQRNKGTDERKHDKGKEKNREDEGDDDDNSNIEHEKKAKRLTLINLIPGSKKKEKESHRKHKGKDEEAEQHKKEKKKKKKKKKKKCKKKKQQKAEKPEQVEGEDKEEVKAESTVRPPSSIFLNLSRKYAISDDDDELERERRREQLHRTLQRRRKSRSARADSPSLNKRVTAAFGVKKEEALRGLGSEVKSPVLRLRTETKYVPFSQAFLHLQQHQQEDECDHEEKKKAEDANEETEEEEDKGQEEITIPAFRRECHYSAMPEWNTETKEPSTQAPPNDDETEENVIVSPRRMIRPDLRPELFLSCAQSSASSSSSANKSIWQKSKPKAKEEGEEEGAGRNYGKIPSFSLQDGTTTSNNSTNKEELLSTSQNGALVFFLRGGRSGTRTSEGINIKKRTVPLIGGSRNKEAQNDEVKRETERQRKIVWQKRMVQQWAIDYDELELIDEIGYGSFGVVWKAKWRNSTVVVKKFFFQTLSKQQLDDFLHESMIMMTLRPHANVVQFLGVCLRQPNLCLVSEYIPDGDLLHLLRNNNLFLRTKLELALGIAAGMTHLHKENIVHCDLSARNCLVTRHPETREYSVKLTDFGMAIGGVKEVFVPGSVFGPLKWMSVEAIDPSLRRLSKESDVWSFGVVAWELLTNGKEPFEGMTPEQAANAILSGRRLEIPSSCPEPLEQLIESCWQEEPTKRPTFQQIYASLEELLLSFPSPPLSTAAAQRRRSTAARRGTLLPAPGKTEANHQHNNSNTL